MAINLYRSVCVRAYRHTTFLLFDPWFLLCTCFCVLFLAARHYRVFMQMREGDELILYSSTWLLFSSWSWTGTIPFIGWPLDLLVTLCLSLTVAASFLPHHVISSGIQRYCLDCMWALMCPKVVWAYLRLLLGRVWKNEQKLWYW